MYFVCNHSCKHHVASSPNTTSQCLHRMLSALNVFLAILMLQLEVSQCTAGLQNGFSRTNNIASDAAVNCHHELPEAMLWLWNQRQHHQHKHSTVSLTWTELLCQGRRCTLTPMPRRLVAVWSNESRLWHSMKWHYTFMAVEVWTYCSQLLQANDALGTRWCWYSCYQWPSLHLACTAITLAHRLCPLFPHTATVYWRSCEPLSTLRHLKLHIHFTFICFYCDRSSQHCSMIYRTVGYAFGEW